MPQRSNEFQALIFLLESQLATKGFTVTESKFLKSVVNYENTEIDIVIEGEVNKIPITIAIECTAESRPKGIEWVREMAGKYKNLPVSNVILVSKSGFTQSAVDSAQLLDPRLNTLSLENAAEQDWTEFVGKTKEMKWEYSLTLPKNVFPGFEHQEGDLPTDLSFIDKNVLIFASDGEKFGTLDDIVHGILALPAIYNEMKATVPNHGKDGSYIFDLTYDSLPEGMNIIDPKGQKLYLKKIRIEGQYVIQAENRPLYEGMYKNIPFAYGTGSRFGQTFLVVFTEAEDKNLKLGIKIQHDKKPKSEGNS